MPSEHGSRTVFKSLEDKLKKARDREEVTAPQTAQSNVKARSWVRSSARQLLEQPTRANLGNLKGSTDGFTVQKHLCYKPVGNQQAAADFSGSLRQGMLKYYDVSSTKACTSLALAFPPVDPHEAQAAATAYKQRPRTTAEQAQQEGQQGSQAAPAADADSELPAEVALAKQMGVDLADVARLLRIKIQEGCAGGDANAVTAAAAAGAARSQGPSAPTHGTGLLSTGTAGGLLHAAGGTARPGTVGTARAQPLRRPGTAGQQQQQQRTGSQSQLIPPPSHSREKEELRPSSHAFISPASLRLRRFEKTKKNEARLEMDMQVSWAVAKAEKDLMPVMTASRAHWQQQ